MSLSPHGSLHWLPAGLLIVTQPCTSTCPPWEFYHRAHVYTCERQKRSRSQVSTVRARGPGGLVLSRPLCPHWSEYGILLTEAAAGRGSRGGPGRSSRFSRTRCPRCARRTAPLGWDFAMTGYGAQEHTQFSCSDALPSRGLKGRSCFASGDSGPPIPRHVRREGHQAWRRAGRASGLHTHGCSLG